MSEETQDKAEVETKFNPSEHLQNIQGKPYLPVAARLIWFRELHPDWGIQTIPLDINVEKRYAVFGASIVDEAGRVRATASKFENAAGFPDYIEKAETGAIGRALALCGIGTQWAVQDLDEGDRLADSPYRAAQSQAPRGYTQNRPAQVVEQARTAPRGQGGYNNAPRAGTTQPSWSDVSKAFRDTAYQTYRQTGDENFRIGAGAESQPSQARLIRNTIGDDPAYFNDKGWPTVQAMQLATARMEEIQQGGGAPGGTQESNFGDDGFEPQDENPFN